MGSIKVFRKEIKLSEFADDTTLFNADMEPFKRASKFVGDLGKILKGFPVFV